MFGYVLTLNLLSLTLVHSERIKDVAVLAGVRDNQLIGYGLVAGLNGTGDSSSSRHTSDSFANLLTHMGVVIPVGTKLESKNLAAVTVTAHLASFVKKGQTIDVNISSIGNAKSLQGGTLLFTQLKGADGRIYAIAQGNVVVSGFSASAGDGTNSVTLNSPSSGRIPNGATVEEDIPNPFYFDKTLTYNLNSPDFTTAKQMADAINELMGPATAKPLDATSIVVAAPKKMEQRVDYVSILENIEFKMGEGIAKIIFNGRSGTVVISENVTVKTAAVSHGNLVVSVSNDLFGTNGFQGLNNFAEVTAQQKNNHAFVLPKGTTIKDIVRGINAVGATPYDVMSILDALKQAGAINATIIVI
jgi:flagellar P-ring protein precursor FlgI